MTLSELVRKLCEIGGVFEDVAVHLANLNLRIQRLEHRITAAQDEHPELDKWR